MSDLGILRTVVHFFNPFVLIRSFVSLFLNPIYKVTFHTKSGNSVSQKYLQFKWTKNSSGFSSFEYQQYDVLTCAVPIENVDAISIEIVGWTILKPDNK